MLWRSLFSMLSPAGAQARLSILIFHRVLPGRDPLFPGEIDAAGFDQVCARLARWFQVLPLDEAVERLQRGQLPARAAVITFDDGYADNHDVALPILQRHGLCATFYIATGFLDGGRMWNDSVIAAVRHSPLAQLDLSSLGLDGIRSLPLGDVAQRRAAIEALIKALKYLPQPQRLERVAQVAQCAGATLPDDLMMRSDQVRALHSAGMQIGAHTVSHPILAGLDDAAAEREIDTSRQQLQALLGAPVRHFAYPNGVPGRDFTTGTAALVRRLGFDSAVTTGWGAARRGADPHQLPRFTPWDRSAGRWALRLAQNLRSR